MRNELCGTVRPTFFPSPSQFRAWLAKHHASASELEVGFYKKNSGKKSITYQEALDQALCYGWIDGVRHRIDDVSYRNRFTPRRPKSKWSNVNLRHFARLKKAGLMRPPGLKAFERRDTKAAPYRALAPSYLKTLRANPRAWAFFQAQPPGYRRLMTYFVMEAKQEKTRQRRLDVLIAHSARAERIPLMAPASRRG